MVTLNDFVEVPHSCGKDYKSYQIRGTNILLNENSTLKKGKNGVYRYKPSGLFTYSQDGMSCGNYAYDYCFGPTEKAIELYIKLFG